MQEKKEKFIELVKEKNAQKNLKYAILTMGCQLNENDSEKLSGMLTKMGYEVTECTNGTDVWKLIKKSTYFSLRQKFSLSLHRNLSSYETTIFIFHHLYARIDYIVPAEHSHTSNELQCT